MDEEMDIDESGSSSGYSYLELDNHHRLGNESAAENYSATHTSTYEMLEDELKGRVLVEQETVWDQLKVDNLERDLVENCCQQLRISCKREIDGLRAVTDSHRKAGSEVTESCMYPYLSSIFKFIEKFTAPITTLHQPIRHFVRVSSLMFDKRTNPYMTGFPDVSPDFQLETVLEDAKENEKSRYWKDKDGFCEVKLDSHNGPPKKTDPNAEREILTQSANYARLHMSARPFLLFSIGLLIYGRKFCVLIFDRGGVRISPEKDMWSDLDTFVRVVRSLTCVLDARGIGQDPSVRLRKTPKKPASYVIKPIGKDPKSWCTIGSPIWSSLSLFGRGTVVWKVKEYNEAEDDAVGPAMIMKTAWRQAHRNPESSLSRYVTAIAKHNPEVSVAEFVTGGDVYVEGGSPPDMRVATEPISEPSGSGGKAGTLITVPYLRLQGEAKEGDSPILHRVITSTVGRPLWEYSDEKELARAFIAVLNSHKKLCELNVLHRDISPGNILLAENPQTALPGREGFLSDFELARVGDEVGVYVYERVGSEAKRRRKPFDRETDEKQMFLSGSGTGLEAPITGTLQFMAVDLLDVITKQAQRSLVLRTAFKQQAYHDLESIVWVLSYILLRRLHDIASNTDNCEEVTKHLNVILRQVFGRTKVIDIWSERQLVAPLRWVNEDDLEPFLNEHLSSKMANTMRILLRKLDRLFQSKRSRQESKKLGDDIKDPEQDTYKETTMPELTHEYMISLFQQII